MKKGKKANRKKNFLDKLHLRSKLSLSENIFDKILSEKITKAVFWILLILLIIWLLSMFT